MRLLIVCADAARAGPVRLQFERLGWRVDVEAEVRGFREVRYDLVIADLEEAASLARQMHAPPRPVPVPPPVGFADVVAQSPAMRAALETAARAARSDATVLIHGETGTGKELLARCIHDTSRRGRGPFVAVNCGAIPRDLLESELFGHVRGAFTGAVTGTPGRVELAAGGTLFLDEVGDLPLDLQVKLLRLVQHLEVEKVGAGRPTQVDVRILAATHRDLAAMVADGSFREDLYYRLAVLPLEIPPLRDRPDDVPVLIQRFLDRERNRYGRPELQMTARVALLLAAHTWPGNVRELENVVERLVVLADGDEILVEDLPAHLRHGIGAVDSLRLVLPPQGLPLDQLERELLERALERHGGNQSKTARYLGVTRKTLIYRLAKYGLANGVHQTCP